MPPARDERPAGQPPQNRPDTAPQPTLRTIHGSGAGGAIVWQDLTRSHGAGK